ncbi:MAG: hypothetical protein R3A79_01410 [Nannocystaceae bacterium]
MPALPVVLAALLGVAVAEPAAPSSEATGAGAADALEETEVNADPAVATPSAAQAGDDPPREAKISERLKDPQARRHYEVANRHFVERRYGLAAQELAFAYRVEPLPELLLQRAMILDADGRCDEGIALLEEFLAAAPSPGKADRARYMIDDCRKRRGIAAPASAGAGAQQSRHTAHPDGQASDAEPTNADVAAGGGEAAPPAATRDRPWYRDPAGGVLLGVGGAAALSGGGLLIAATQLQRAADGSALHSDYDAAHRRAVLFQSIGGGALVAGAALTVGALLRYRSLRQQRAGAGRGRAPTPSAWLGTHGGGVSLSGRF